MASSYAVYYANNGAFLLGWKLAYGYYFGNLNGQGGIVHDGERLNGGFEPALPGGARNPGENWIGAAWREFAEETGYSPVYKDPHQQVFTVDIHTFGAGYFRVNSEAVLREEADDINRALIEANYISNAISQGIIQNYADIQPWVNAYRDGAIWPASNELETIMVCNILNADTWVKIQSWENDPFLGWFYVILHYLRTNILQVPAQMEETIKID